MKGRKRYKIGDFRFVTDPGHLSLDGQTIALSPQGIRLLTLLIDAGEDGLSRIQIIRAIWPSGNLADFDQSLNSSVRQLRRALDDTGRTIIQTIPRRGYKLGIKVHAPNRHLPSAFSALVLIAVSAVSLFLVFANPRSEPLPALDRNALIAARTQLASGGVEDLEAARQSFAHLVARRPDLAEAAGGYALATVLLAGRAGRDWIEWTARAEASSRAALDLAPLDDSAHTTLAFIALYRDWQPELAEVHAMQAVMQEPHNGYAYLVAAAVAAANGDTETAAQLADQAVLVQPQAIAAISDRCWYHFFTRAFDVAVVVCGQAANSEGVGIGGRLAWAEALYRQGRRERALSILQQVDDRLFVPAGLNPVDGDGWRRAHCHFVETMESQPSTSSVQLAAHQLACGDRESALDSLDIGLASRESGMLFLQLDPRFDPLRGNLRFEALIACLSLQPCD
jgi:DNA-binding winged helix-turn-helix (wHTH) protein/tetratricopeptide (TPR) repeat protein